MKVSPCVTVLIPTYNRAPMLRNAIQSVLGQSFSDFELVILDNASPDETPSVVASFNDPRAVYVRNSVNLGMIGNFNHSLAHIRGRYFLWLACDEILLPKSLEQLVTFLDAHSDVPVVYGRYEKVDMNLQVLPGGEQNFEYLYGMGSLIATDLIIDNYLRQMAGNMCLTASLLNTEFIKSHRLAFRQYQVADFYFTLEVALRSRHFGFIDDVLQHRVVHDLRYYDVPNPMHYRLIDYLEQIHHFLEEFGGQLLARGLPLHEYRRGLLYRLCRHAVSSRDPAIRRFCLHLAARVGTELTQAGLAYPGAAAMHRVLLLARGLARRGGRRESSRE